MAKHYDNDETLGVPYKLIGVCVLIFSLAIIAYNSVGYNYAGWRTVVQTPGGNIYVKFSTGPYFQLFGTVTSYPDFITFDFDKDAEVETNDPSTLSQKGIAVQYQEGGKGSVYGQVRFQLPADPASMLELHRAYHSAEGIAYKLIRPTVEQVADLTAKLMTSDESYMEKSSVYLQWAKEQLQKGLYRTRMENRRIRSDEAVASEKEADDDGMIWKEVPVIATDPNTKMPIHESSDIDKYSVTLATLQITARDYEEKTINQISERREANMQIITARANAERAKQDAITAEEVGKRNVMVAKYEKEVIKAQAIVEAEQRKEVATITAKQKVSVAEQEKLEQEQKKLAAAEYKQAETLRGEGDAAYKRAVLEADGALQQKLDAYVEVQKAYAAEFGKHKLVPDIVFGQSANGEVTPAAVQYMEMLGVKAAKDLLLDLDVKK